MRGVCPRHRVHAFRSPGQGVHRVCGLPDPGAPVLPDERYGRTAKERRVTFVENCLEHRQVKNNGQMGMYHMLNNHEAIVNLGVEIA